MKIIRMLCRVIAPSCLSFCVLHSFAQEAGIQWKKRIGGNGNDIIKKIIEISPVPNERYMVYGNSSSTDEMPTIGATDVWVSLWTGGGERIWSKYAGFSRADDFADALHYVDSSSFGYNYVAFKAGTSGVYSDFGLSIMTDVGNTEWTKRYGGAGDDIPIRLVLADHGVVVAGNSTSTDLPGHHGGTDIYVIRVNLSGTLLWERCLGGGGTDVVSSVLSDEEGNIYVGGTTSSADGDVTDAKGGGDFWIIKLNASGDIIWKRTYGGSQPESLEDMKFDGDGNLLAGGRASSLDGDVTGFHYPTPGAVGADAWLVKIDTSGSILWAKCYGGSWAEEIKGLVVNDDGSIYFTSATTSSDGDVTGNHSYAYADVWVVKLDSNGNIIWQRSLGGTNTDTFLYLGESVLTKREAIDKDSDGGCIITAYTNSTDGDVTGLHGTNPDVWLLKIDPAGTLLWQRAVGGSGKDLAGDFVATSDGKYFAGIYSNSSDGDLQGTYGGQDGLLMKIGPINHIKGTVFVDFNDNNIMDGPDLLYPHPIKIQAARGGDTSWIITEDGRFDFDADTGTYVTRIPAPPSIITVNPALRTSVFNQYLNTDSFGFALKLVSRDIFVRTIPLSRPRVGSQVDYLVLYGNLGTDTLYDVDLGFSLSGPAEISGASVAATTQTANSSEWSFTQLNPFEAFKEIIVHANINVGSLGDTLQSVASIAHNGTDDYTGNNADTSRLVITGSFDPNDKMELHAGRLSTAQANNRDYLNYVIRFQNTGTDTAFRVVVKDTLLSRIDPATLQMIYSTHTYKMSMNDEKIITWTFENINLPDSNINEPLSHGSIVFQARPIPGLTGGDTVHNYASIYFDTNDPVRTNNAFAVVESLVTLPVKLESFWGSYREKRAFLDWVTAGETGFDRFEVERSRDGVGFETAGVVAGGQRRYGFVDDLSAETGTRVFYRLRMIDRDGTAEYSRVLVLYLEKRGSEYWVFPNPASDRIFVKGMKEPVRVSLSDARGKLVFVKDVTDSTEETIEVVLPRLSSGIYLMELKMKDGSSSVVKVVISGN